ncbi:MAG TPA: hypothetical protein VLK84_32710 [Longimicrobium sp.]|nr:hypothetical protein [Longimicrobium sp.]
MDDGARLRVDLRDRKAPAWRRMSRPVRYAVIIAGALLLVAVREGLERVSPGAGVAFGLWIRWLLALAWVFLCVTLWRIWDRDWLPVRWLVLLGGATAWFVGRAAYETYVALT